jgi:hypothetical protein
MEKDRQVTVRLTSSYFARRAGTIRIVDHAGNVISEGTVNAEPQAIAWFLTLKAPGAVRIGIETGPSRAIPANGTAPCPDLLPKLNLPLRHSRPRQRLDTHQSRFLSAA